MLITGANGHLGQRLLRRLALRSSAGTTSAVRAAVRSKQAASAVHAFAPSSDCVIVDYHDVDGLARAAERCHAIVHLVGILKEGARTRYVEAHEGAAHAIAAAAEKAGVGRIVYLSILGASAGSENACLASKGRAEAILLARAVPTTVIRLPMVLGADQPAALALKAKAMRRVLPLVRGGASREQPIDADDVTTALLAAARPHPERGEILDLAGPESLSHRALVMRIAQLLGRRPRIVPVPLALVRSFAWIAERTLANPPLTRPMLEVLEHNDEIDPAPACRRLGLALTPLDDTLRRCLLPDAPA
jgi:NADH dehydrogenase